MTPKSLRTTFAQKLEGPDQFLQAGVKKQLKIDPSGRPNPMHIYETL